MYHSHIVFLFLLREIAPYTPPLPIVSHLESKFHITGDTRRKMRGSQCFTCESKLHIAGDTACVASGVVGCRQVADTEAEFPEGRPATHQPSQIQIERIWPFFGKTKNSGMFRLLIAALPPADH